jgi:hypothetical protein
MDFISKLATDVIGVKMRYVAGELADILEIVHNPNVETLGAEESKDLIEVIKTFLRDTAEVFESEATRLNAAS